jgi:hypothetical protein
MKATLVRRPRNKLIACALGAAWLGAIAPSALRAAAEPASLVKVTDGVVQPRRPVAAAVADALQFLRKADGQYVPGRTDGDLAGYFNSAFVNEDGTRATRALSFPARQHGYFIRTFLNYYYYTGDREWLLRARDLADWDLGHSTPAEAAYPNLPYSAFEKGQPTGSADKNSTEPDKAAFIGTGYVGVYEATGDARYLEGARRIAATLLRHQRPDGSWAFRVIPGDGKIYQDLGGAPVFYVEFFEALLRHGDNPDYRRSLDAATRLMIARNVERAEWGTYHEDIAPKDGTHLSAEPMSFTAAYLFRHAGEHPEYIGYGQRVLRQMEATLVHTTGHAAAPAPAVAEQVTYAHIMPGHTARYCLALAEEYRAAPAPALKQRALSGLAAATYMQAENGLFRTYFYDVKKKTDNEAGRPNWYSQHLYTVCHMLECMPAFPELAPEGQSHVLGVTAGLREVRYAAGSLSYTAAVPATVVAKLAFVPGTVKSGTRAIPRLDAGARASGAGWTYDAATHVITIVNQAGAVAIAK